MGSALKSRGPARRCVESDPSGWSWWIWSLHGMGVLYAFGFAVYYVRLERLERRAVRGGEVDLRRFNAVVGRFPGSFYAKMCGKRRLEPDEVR